MHTNCIFSISECTMIIQDNIDFWLQENSLGDKTIFCAVKTGTLIPAQFRCEIDGNIHYISLNKDGQFRLNGLLLMRSVSECNSEQIYTAFLKDSLKLNISDSTSDVVHNQSSGEISGIGNILTSTPYVSGKKPDVSVNNPVLGDATPSVSGKKPEVSANNPVVGDEVMINISQKLSDDEKHRLYVFPVRTIRIRTYL